MKGNQLREPAPKCVASVWCEQPQRRRLTGRTQCLPAPGHAGHAPAKVPRLLHHASKHTQRGGAGPKGCAPAASTIGPALLQSSTPCCWERPEACGEEMPPTMRCAGGGGGPGELHRHCDSHSIPAHEGGANAQGHGACLFRIPCSSCRNSHPCHHSQGKYRRTNSRLEVQPTSRWLTNMQLDQLLHAEPARGSDIGLQD